MTIGRDRRSLRKAERNVAKAYELLNEASELVKMIDREVFPSVVAYPSMVLVGIAKDATAATSGFLFEAVAMDRKNGRKA